MIGFTYYLVQSGICLAILFAIYWIFMRSDTFFGLQRMFLVSSVLFSAVLPLFQFKIEMNNIQPEYRFVLDKVVITPGGIAESIDNHYDLYKILIWIYLSGSGILLFRLLVRLITIAILAVKSDISKKNGFRLAVAKNVSGPFSFFNLIFIDKEVIDKNILSNILTHEQVHVRQKHTLDVLLIEFILILQWINPFIWFYKKTIRNLHEFLADRGVLTEGINAAEYKQMLVNLSFRGQIYSLSNHFNHSLIKRRIIMMSKTKTHRLALLKMVFVIPLAILITAIISVSLTEKIVAQEKADKSEIREVRNEIHVQEDSIYAVAESMPRFPGGDEARIKYLVENIKYPEEARKKGITGRVFISFVVEKNGAVTNVKVLRGIGNGCDEEAVRVISNMPDWEPGKDKGKTVRTQFNMPIQFSLSENPKKPEENQPKNQ